MESRLAILDAIRRQFIALGFESIVSNLCFDKRDVWLLRRHSRETKFSTVLYLQYKPTFKAYSIAFGVLDDGIVQQMRRLLIHPSVQDFLRDWKCARPVELPCWNLFSVGRGLGWPFLCIPDLDDPNAWEFEMERLNSVYLNGVAYRIDGDESFAEFLLRADKPFEWRMSDPVLRAGEVALALVRCGRSTGAITSALEPVRECIENALGQGRSVTELVRLICTYAH